MEYKMYIYSYRCFYSRPKWTNHTFNILQPIIPPRWVQQEGLHTDATKSAKKKKASTDCKSTLVTQLFNYRLMKLSHTLHTSFCHISYSFKMRWVSWGTTGATYLVIPRGDPVLAYVMSQPALTRVQKLYFLKYLGVVRTIQSCSPQQMWDVK